MPGRGTHHDRTTTSGGTYGEGGGDVGSAPRWKFTGGGIAADAPDERRTYRGTTSTNDLVPNNAWNAFQAPTRRTDTEEAIGFATDGMDGS